MTPTHRTNLEEGKKTLHFLEHWQLGLAINGAAISRVSGSVSDARALPSATVTH